MGDLKLTVEAENRDKVAKLLTRSEGQNKQGFFSVFILSGDIRQGVIGGIAWQVVSPLLGVFSGWPWVPVSMVGLLILAAFMGVRIVVRIRAMEDILEVYHEGLTWQQREIARQDATVETGALIAELDDSLLRLLSELVAAKNKAQAWEKLQKEFLSDLTRLFRGDVHRACILRPHTDRDYLTRVASIGMPGADNVKTNQYIGPKQDVLRGSAGKTFTEKTVRKVQMGDGASGDKGNSKEMDYLPSKEKRSYIPYKAFVCTPILFANTDGTSANCLGVFCLDSERPDAFDQPIDDILLLLGRRIAAAIMVYENLKGKRQRTEEVVKTDEK